MAEEHQDARSSSQVGESRVLDSVPKNGIKVMSVERGETPVKIHHRRYKCFTCVGITAAAITALIIVVGVLVFTVFHPRDPKIKLESVILLSWQFECEFPELLPSANVSLEITVAVKNPNRASFKYGASKTRFYYRESQVGQASFPGAVLAADRTEIQTSLVTVQINRFMSNPFLLYDFARGEFPVSSQSEVKGHVNVLNIFKHRAHARAHCAMVLFTLNRTVGAMFCDYKVSLN